MTRRNCLITGASRGIGLGIARRLDADGYRLALTCRDTRSRDRLAGHLRAFKASGHLPLLCDVADPAQIEAAFAEVDGAFGGIDALVVNAGVHQMGPALEMDLAEWNRLFAIDVRAAMLFSREAARRMAARGTGAIVLIGSIAGERAAANRSAYCAAKAAVHAFARSVALEWAPLGIRVNVVAPGPIDTEFLDEPAEKAGGRGAIAERVPLGRLGTPEDVASAVAYLLSDEASFITGAEIRVDGGRIGTS